MLFTHENKDFKEHVHVSLQKRLRMFIIIGAIMLALVGWDLYDGALSLGMAAIAMLVGGVVGFISSRIFHLSWDTDGLKVVGRIDTIGWIVLALYIAFELARNFLFETILHPTSSITAITFAFVAAALLTRVLGMRGKIVKILQEEKLLG